MSVPAIINNDRYFSLISLVGVACIIIMLSLILFFYVRKRLASRVHSETLPTKRENTPDEVELISRDKNIQLEGISEKENEEIIYSNILVQQIEKLPTDDIIIVDVDKELLSTLASSSHSRKFERSNTGSHPHSYSGKSRYDSSFESGSSHFSSECTRIATGSQYLSAVVKSHDRDLQHTAGSRRSYTTFDSEYESTSELSSGSSIADEGGKND